MNRFIENPIQKAYDLVVIGGGITGAAVAYEAASHGFSVALVDKGDFGAATSAATSKLIHGGLRYLANMELSLVRESLRERKTLENIAPNLVYPLPFLLPLYQDKPHRNKWVMAPGMWLYDILSYDKGFTWDRAKKLPMHRLLGREKVLELEPVVKAQGLNGGIRFFDCANLNPERLTLAFIKSAVKRGAQAANYARVEGFIREGERVTGVVVRDLISGRTVTLAGKLTINCGGPWADLLLEVARGEECPQHIRRSEGIHIITPSLTHSNCVATSTAAGRSFNIIPWRGHALIGTTDREYTGDPDRYQVTRPKIEQFIAEINSSLDEGYHIQYSDVRYAYGGLRPLVDDQSSDVLNASRKYEIYDNETDGLAGLITVEGGKYTTSRNLAENVLKLVVKKIGGSRQKSITDCTFLAGCEIPDIAAFVAAVQAANRDFDPAAIETLARLYGTEINSILQIARSDPKYAAALTHDGEMLAQVLYAIRSEMALTLLDVLIRRTGIGTLGNPGDQILERVAECAAAELNWSTARVDQELCAAAQALTTPV